MTEPSVTPLEQSVRIEASPDAVWRVVSDLRRMGEWSPECIRMHIWGGTVREGARVTGINRRKLLVWPTTSRIHRYDDGAAIGWTVWENRAQWSYQLQADGTGTRLTERRDMPNGTPVLARLFATALLGGVDDHDEELQTGMRATLERIKAVCESPG